MKIRNIFLCKTAALTLAALVGFTGAAFAAEAAKTEAETPAEAVEVPEAEIEIRTIGTDGEDAERFELTNKTGKDITFISFRVDDGTDVKKEEVKTLQEALIEQGFLDDVADGIYGPKTKAAVKAYREENGLSAEEIVDDEMIYMLFPDYDDGNILGEDEVIKADETVVIFFREDAADKEESVEVDPNQILTYKNYIAEFQLAEDETEYVLHSLTMNGETMNILLEGNVPYIVYEAAGSGNLISTLETEYAILYPPVQTYSYSDYDDGYYDDYSYYDDSYYYDEPVYENPAQEEDGCIDSSQAIFNP